MKTLTLILIITLAGLLSYAQNKTFDDDIYFNPETQPYTIEKQQWKQIPKYTKIIEINTSQTAAENFKQVTNTLLDNNLEIAKRDKELSTISTEFIPLPKTGSYKLRFRCKNNKIIVSGLWTSGISIQLYGVRSEDSAYIIEKRGQRTSLYGYSFAAMQQFAEKLGTITYQ